MFWLIIRLQGAKSRDKFRLFLVQREPDNHFDNKNLQTVTSPSSP